MAAGAVEPLLYRPEAFEPLAAAPWSEGRVRDAIAKIVADAQADGEFREDVSPDFASMLFYGAIEQLLTGWIFEVVPASDQDYENAKGLVVETICGGLEPRPAADRLAG